MNLLMLPWLFVWKVQRGLAKLKRRFRSAGQGDAEVALPYFPQTYEKLAPALRSGGWQLSSSQSLRVSFLRTFIHERLAGRRLLRFVVALEERFPRFMGRYGEYPMFTLKKT
jgi:hypothetical protein